MVTYFTGSTFNQIIQGSIEEVDELVYQPKIEEDQDFLKFIKQNLNGLSGVDCLILDTSVCINTDAELLNALEMIRTMYDAIRIIVFAPYHETGNGFLTSCLNMGITNIINTDDFNLIRDELKYCVTKGKTYREAVKYKESHPEKVVVKHAKRAVNKRMIGIAGAESNIGTTHNTLVLANYFRKKGFMVAVAEVNDSGAFMAICEDFEESMFEDGYYTMNGIDFYPSADEEKLQSVQKKSYNVILLDFGAYGPDNKEAFERCEDKIIIAGSKSWELEAVNRIFANASKDVLMKYVFCFNFTQEKDYEVIRSGMGELESVHFLKYSDDPFSDCTFPDGDEIFMDILPEKPQEEQKKGIFAKLLSRKSKAVVNERSER